MRIALMLLLALVVAVTSAQNPTPQSENSPVTVVNSKWYKDRQKVETPDPGYVGPAAAMSSLNKVNARNARANDPRGALDPNTMTTDGRAATLDQAVQDSRTPQGEPVDGYAYQLKIRNTSDNVIDVLFWEYQFIDTADPANSVRRQFLCGVGIKPGKDKEVYAFGLHGPSDVVNVGSLAKNKSKPFEEKVVINRIEFTDGSSWQRKDWNAAEIRLAYKRALSTPWKSEMCRPL